jgi:hypothetical protein
VRVHQPWRGGSDSSSSIRNTARWITLFEERRTVTCFFRPDRAKSILLPVQLAANIRPEFLHYQSDRIPAHLRAPYAARIPQRSITARMIGIRGDGRGYRASCNFREIELGVPGVGARDHDAAHGISEATAKPALARLIKPRILLRERRQNRTGYEVLYGVIGKRCPVTLPVARGALPEPRFTIFRLADACEKRNRRTQPDRTCLALPP